MFSIMFVLDSKEPRTRFFRRLDDVEERQREVKAIYYLVLLFFFIPLALLIMYLLFCFIFSRLLKQILDLHLVSAFIPTLSYFDVVPNPFLKDHFPIEENIF